LTITQAAAVCAKRLHALPRGVRIGEVVERQLLALQLR
jgi:hypothetical protein